MAAREELSVTVLRLGDDGETLVAVKAGAPTSGTTGTLAGEAGPGSLLIDRTNAKLYINTGTKASPTWTVTGSQTT